MTVLIIAEHDNAKLNPATLHAVTAAQKLGEVHVWWPATALLLWPTKPSR